MYARTSRKLDEVLCDSSQVREYVCMQKQRQESRERGREWKENTTITTITDQSGVKMTTHRSIDQKHREDHSTFLEDQKESPEEQDNLLEDVENSNHQTRVQDSVDLPVEVIEHVGLHVA